MRDPSSLTKEELVDVIRELQTIIFPGGHRMGSGFDDCYDDLNVEDNATILSCIDEALSDAGLGPTL